MKKPSELEQFLKGQIVEGEMDSSGAFTLAKDKALAKLAEFQLPFAQAWSVKVIQAIVASQTLEPITVALSSKESRIEFEFGSKWSLDDIEQRFFDPDASAENGIGHLVSGLWAVGLNEMRAFHLVIAGENESLMWNGEKMTRVPSRGAHSSLTVSHAALYAPEQSWFAKMVGGSSHNAEILGVLSRYCFTCPVPLTVDAMRIDSLQLCPRSGWSKETYPISVSFSNSGLPEWPIPQGTFMDLPAHSSRAWDGGGLKDLASSVLGDLKSHPQAGMACMLSVHLVRVKSGKNYRWKESQGPSRCHWVVDGAVVESEVFGLTPNLTSVGVFISGQGLATDLTGLSLQESEERTRRKEQAGRTVSEHLSPLSEVDAQEFVAQGKRKGFVFGGLFTLVGLGVMALSPLHGIAFSGAGIFIMFSGGSDRESRVESIRMATKYLSDSFRDSYPDPAGHVRVDDLDWAN